MKTEAIGTVIPLSDTISVAEAEKAATKVKEEIKKQQEYLKELQGYRDESKALSKLVKRLPDSVSYNIMVPFGKAAFFPGRLIHTNEFLVSLGEGYYSERSAKQTVDILERRNQLVQSKIANVESHVLDLEAEASFASNTAAEAKAGVVEIREQLVEGDDKPFDQRSKSTSTKADSFNQARSKSQDEASHSASYSYGSGNEYEEHNTIMDRIAGLEATEEAAGAKSEEEEHQLIMARIAALEAAEEAAGAKSDEEEMSDEEGAISIDDAVDDAEAIIKSKSYLSKDQKATLLDKLNRSESEDYDSDDSDEDRSTEEEYDIEEDDEEDMVNHRNSSDSELTPQGKGSIERHAEGSKKTPRPLSRFGREVQSVKDRLDSELAQRPIASQNPQILEKIIPSLDDKSASCSGLEIPDMQGHDDLQKLKYWSTQESPNQGFVLGREAEKKITVEPKNNLKESQNLGKPIARQNQAFTGTVTEHISRSSFPIRTETIAEQGPRASSKNDAGQALERITKPSRESEQQVEEQPARPVSKFRQMRQTGGR